MTAFERSARSIFRGVVADCDPEVAFARVVPVESGYWIVGGARIDFEDVDDVRIVAMGKPARGLVGACLHALDAAGVSASARSGIIACPGSDAIALAAAAGSRFDVVAGGHPSPDAGSFRAGRRMLDLVSRPATTRTIVVALVGGGGSAMAELPISTSTSIDASAALYERLVRANLSIREINAVRKRVSAIKGGRLTIAASPARVVTLAVSDVTPGDLGSVASGPTIEDVTTRGEALDALARVNASATSGTYAGPVVSPYCLVEPPAWSEDDRRRSSACVLLDSDAAAGSAARHATKFADVVVNLGVVDGPIESVAQGHLDRLLEVTAANRGKRCAVVSSGEATLTVKGSGTGGRNQHFVLLALDMKLTHLQELADFAILSAGTDGVDGNSIAAGGVVTTDTLAAIGTGGLEMRTSLASFDSAALLERLGAQVVTGPTGTNVRDVRVLLGLRR